MGDWGLAPVGLRREEDEDFTSCDSEVVSGITSGTVRPLRGVSNVGRTSLVRGPDGGGMT